MLPTQYGSFFKRLVAHLADVIIATLLAGIVVLIMGMLMAATGLLAGISLELFDSLFYMNDPADFFRHLMVGLPVASILFLGFVFNLLYWFYFALFESSPRQATPGKMMLGLFVTDMHGRRITFGRAFGRTIGKILSQMFCWLGYILALFTARKQALHDLMASTLVLEPAWPTPMVAAPAVSPPASPVSPDLASVSVPGAPAPVRQEPVVKETPQPEPELKEEPQPEAIPATKEPEVDETAEEQAPKDVAPEDETAGQQTPEDAEPEKDDKPDEDPDARFRPPGWYEKTDTEEDGGGETGDGEGKPEQENK